MEVNITVSHTQPASQTAKPTSHKYIQETYPPINNATPATIINTFRYFLQEYLLPSIAPIIMTGTGFFYWFQERDGYNKEVPMMKR